MTTPTRPDLPSSRLGVLLRDLAQEQPAVSVPPETWRRARRSLRRRRAAVAMTAAASVLAATLGLSSLADQRAGLDPAAPGTTPAMPSDLWGVPPRLVTTGGSGPRWDEALRAETLAVGVTAAVLTVADDALVAVSAEDGRYRGLRLPGLRAGGSDDSDGEGIGALSPDGRRLAYTWSDPDAPGPSPDGVRVLDLVTGEITDHAVPSTYGVQTSDFSWSPSGRYLAYGIRIATDPRGGVRGARNVRTERLDTTTGERVRIPRQSGEVAPAVNDAGEVALLNAGVIVDPDTGVETRFDGGGDDRAVAWAPDGERLVVATMDGRVRVVSTRGADGGSPGGTRTVRVATADADSWVYLLGWTGDALVLGIEGVDTLRQVSVLAPEGTPPSDESVLAVHDASDASRTVPSGLTLATDLLAGPTRDDPPPSWAVRWYQRTWVQATLALLALAGVAGVAGRTARRR